MSLTGLQSPHRPIASAPPVAARHHDGESLTKRCATLEALNAQLLQENAALRKFVAQVNEIATGPESDPKHARLAQSLQDVESLLRGRDGDPLLEEPCQLEDGYSTTNIEDPVLTKDEQPSQTFLDEASKATVDVRKASNGGSRGQREVICADALEWLRKPNAVPRDSMVFTSLPDESEVREFAPTLEQWKTWFMQAVRLVLEALPSGGVAVFYQTDIRLPDQTQVSKAFLVLTAAAEMDDVELWWHKIAHFGNVDQPAVNAVKFTHVLCFRRRSQDAAADEVSKSIICIPDVFFRGQQPKGLRNSARCMGGGAVLAVLKWVSRRLPHVKSVVDPFCGAGTVLALGNELGFHTIGVDISARRIKQASALDGAVLLQAQHPLNGSGANGQNLGSWQSKGKDGCKANTAAERKQGHAYVADLGIVPKTQHQDGDLDVGTRDA